MIILWLGGCLYFRDSLVGVSGGLLDLWCWCWGLCLDHPMARGLRFFGSWCVGVNVGVRTFCMYVIIREIQPT